MMTQPQARERLYFVASPDAYPEVDNDTLDDILARTKRFATWAASTAYVFGQKVVPSAPNGRMYECIMPGTGGSTEPVWPTFRNSRLLARFTDGAVTWQDAGPAPAEAYDINAAAREVWLWKAAQVATDFDLNDGSSDMKRSQMHAACLAQARRFGWRGAL